MTLCRKIKSLIDNPIRLPAYVEWAASKIIFRRPPLLTLPGGAQVGNWKSFSEYWSFHDLVPESERLFVEHCIRNRSNTNAIVFDLGANVGIFTCLMAA